MNRKLGRPSKKLISVQTVKGRGAVRRSGQYSPDYWLNFRSCDVRQSVSNLDDSMKYIQKVVTLIILSFVVSQPYSLAVPPEKVLLGIGYIRYTLED